MLKVTVLGSWGLAWQQRSGELQTLLVQTPVALPCLKQSCDVRRAPIAITVSSLTVKCQGAMSLKQPVLTAALLLQVGACG